MEYIANVVSIEEDVGKPWREFFPLITSRFNNYIYYCVKMCFRSVLAQIQVIMPNVHVEQLGEEIKDPKIIEAVEEIEPQMDKIADDVVAQLELAGGPLLVKLPGLKLLVLHLLRSKKHKSVI